MEINKKAGIRIFVTGGTFDKEYNYITGKLYFKDTHLREMLQRGRSTLDTRVQTLMMLDSLEMNTEDRELILLNCRRCEEKMIVLTHGTDTMPDTAAFIANAKLPKTILLTGAMIPYQFGNSSDGFFNLGAALAYVQCLPPGVYIAMNGRVFDWNNVKKNRTTGLFEALDD